MGSQAVLSLLEYGCRFWGEGALCWSTYTMTWTDAETKEIKKETKSLISCTAQEGREKLYAWETDSNATQCVCIKSCETSGPKPYTD